MDQGILIPCFHVFLIAFHYVITKIASAKIVDICL